MKEGKEKKNREDKIKHYINNVFFSVYFLLQYLG